VSRSGREVVLGVGGGIAAYKACDLLRRLQDRGFLVTVVPTPACLNFVGAATWEALSGRPAYVHVWENVPKVAHINYAQLADYVLIAPATADLIARLAQGRADDLLTNVALASTVPKLIIPAMHPEMWLNLATIANVATLRERGYFVMEPDVGRLTGPESGLGRFPETSRILELLDTVVGHQADLAGVKVLVTAGGTREPIDPVRYIGNRSSGKQGYAIAQAAVARGAVVQMIAANCLLPNIPGVEIVAVETAAELEERLSAYFPDADVLFMVAAGADATPAYRSSEKIKKNALQTIELVANPDLLAAVTARRKPGQVIVGFAAETQDHLENARRKLIDKGVDLLYVNDVSGGAIFGQDMTQGSLFDHEGGLIHIPQVSKDTLAHELLDIVLSRLGLPNV
jgi:phosphopantothenoylcysteine decarboxylase/phosphopantothenate--cysteine ligase